MHVDLCSCAECELWSIIKQVGLYSPWKDSSATLCRFGLWTAYSLVRHLITPVSKLFRWAFVLIYAKNMILSLILCTFSDICLCRSCGRITWNKELEIFVDFSLWCEDRANLGISRGKGAWGGDSITLESGCHVLKHFEQVVGDLGSSKESHKRPERSNTLNHTSNIIMTALWCEASPSTLFELVVCLRESWQFSVQQSHPSRWISCRQQPGHCGGNFSFQSTLYELNLT